MSEVSISRETAEAARFALRRLNAEDYYANNGKAESELISALGEGFTVVDYAELHARLMAAKDDDVTAILSNNFNIVLGALRAAQNRHERFTPEAGRLIEGQTS